MKKITALATVLASLVGVGASAPAAAQDSTNPNNCPARGRPGRTECLQNMVRQGQVQNAYNSAYLDSLNQSMRKACASAEAADDAAKLLSWVPAQPVKWGGRVWTSARMLSEAAMGTRHDCERLRNELHSR